MVRRLVQTIDLDTGVITEESYFEGELKHRRPAEGPAYVKRDRKTGQPKVIEYYVRGKLHRSDGPAHIHYEKEWSRHDYYQHGIHHRDPAQGAARLFIDNASRILGERYVSNGITHRPPGDGPALIDRSPASGRVIHEHYWRDGDLHRDPEVGPAVIRYSSKTGRLLEVKYFVDGEEVPAPARRSGRKRAIKPKRDPAP